MTIIGGVFWMFVSTYYLWRLSAVSWSMFVMLVLPLFVLYYKTFELLSLIKIIKILTTSKIWNYIIKSNIEYIFMLICVENTSMALCSSQNKNFHVVTLNVWTNA
jgi:hypothetical protein